MLTTALLAYLAAFICYFVQWTFGQPMIDQPLGVGLVAGLRLIRWQERCSLCASWSCLAWSRA